MTGKNKDITFPDGQTRKVEELDFSIVKEDWNEYQTSGGLRVRVKNTLLKIYWVLDTTGNRMYTPEGDPLLLLSGSNQTVAREP
jgi:hypothetical protein